MWEQPEEEKRPVSPRKTRNAFPQALRDNLGRRCTCPAASLQPFSVKKNLRLEDLYTLKRMKCKQIGIARDDVRRVAAHGERKKFIVLGITASCYLNTRIDPLGLAGQGCKKAPYVFLIDIPAELRSAQNL